MEKELRTSTRLLLAEEDPALFVKQLESEAVKALQTEDADELTSFAYGILLSNLRPLGIFVARSLVAMLPKRNASFLFDQILIARDKLNLPPDDPFSDVMDKRYFEDDPEKGTETLRHAQQRLEDKAKEVRELKESLDALQRQMGRREKAAAATPTATPAPALDEAALREMREKVEKLKGALKERHEERNELRRELQKAHADLEALRESSPAPADAEREEADKEEALLLPEENAGTQPVRTIEFPKNFHEKLASLPKSVARGTMTMLGRIAAGEPAAFVGAVRLKACPSVTRVRMGIDFRLLFRLLPDRVQVVDLIPRQDLERRIKTLLTSAHAA